MSFSTPTGLISTLRLPFRYSKFVNCLYTIESGKINSAAVSVDHIYGYTNAGKYYGDSLTVSGQSHIFLALPVSGLWSPSNEEK